jgi:hypothetical protein
MPTVADVMRQYGPPYLEQFGATMPAEHKKVLNAIMACRTRELGTVLYVCTSCGNTHSMGRSCGNRHCPTCQQDKTKAWLENQIGRLLSCPYFLVTFTVPAALRDVIRRNQRVAYAALFDASSAAITKLAADPKFVGSKRCGFFGVLHTWGRTLEYHPHVHYIVPGGAISADGGHWLPSRADFFVPVPALSILFRAKFRDALAREGLLAQVDPAVWRQDWVVHSRAAGDGQASLKYLAPYVFRVAISDHRIVSCDDGQVTFSYRRSGSNRWRKMTLDAPEFIRRFMQHVLPRGFQKVRHYGFLGPNSRFSLDWVSWLISLYFHLTHLLGAKLPPKSAEAPRIRCLECGGPMHVLAYLPPSPVAYFDTS